MYFVELVLKCIKAGGLDIYRGNHRRHHRRRQQLALMLLSSRGVIYAGQTGLEKFYYRSAALGLRPAASDLYPGVGPRHKEMIPYFRFLCKVQGASYLLRHAADAQWAILINSPGDLCHQAQRYNMLMHTHARATQPSHSERQRTPPGKKTKFLRGPPQGFAN
jgi:hypothetical protein